MVFNGIKWYPIYDFPPLAQQISSIRPIIQTRAVKGRGSDEFCQMTLAKIFKILNFSQNLVFTPPNSYCTARTRSRTKIRANLGTRKVRFLNVLTI